MDYSLKKLAQKYQTEFNFCKRYYERTYWMDFSKQEMLAMSYGAKMNASAPPGVMMSHKQAQAVKREFYGETVKQQSLSEELDQSINRLEQVLNKMKESKEVISNLENTFKTGDVVYHKDIGPCLFRRLLIFNGMNGPEDIAFIENDGKLQDGEVLASVMTSGGQVVVLAKSIAPYTESVRLLYEAERNRSNE